MSAERMTTLARVWEQAYRSRVLCHSRNRYVEKGGRAKAEGERGKKEEGFLPPDFLFPLPFSPLSS